MKGKKGKPGTKKVRARKFWRIDPRTRIVDSKKKYRRSAAKNRLKKELKNAESG